MTIIKTNIAKILGLLALALLVPSSYLGAQGLQPLKVGLIPGPDREIMERLQFLAVKRGQILELIDFPSAQECLKALAAGQIDLSVSQHRPLLDDFIAENNFNLISLGNTYSAPLGFYSQKIKSLAELSVGDKLVIQDEPDRKRRALRLLAQYGLIRLDESKAWPTKNDIIENAFHLEIIEAPVVRRYLNDDSIVAIAFTALSDEIIARTSGGLGFWSLCQEEPSAVLVNVVAARRSGRNNPRYLEFVKDYQSQDIARFLLERFEGTIIPVFDLE
ncbi:MAG: hypothetical protein LBS60_10595 [Deltaproteobacteria bacterium]|nr:hypothetical protein [Deltaproteobacteria bacterium]